MDDNYFEWLYDLVCKGRFSEEISFKKVFSYLHNTTFVYSIKMDSNRAKDGVYLRRRYTNDSNYFEGPCSVLEMMIALSIRCEETIMNDENFGNRTDQWFWEMMRSLGLGFMSDDLYDEKYISNVMSTFLNRKYEPDGKGGLFTIRNCESDLRDVEIWTQMLWYLDSIT